MLKLVFLFICANIIFLAEHNYAGKVYNLVSVGSTFSGSAYKPFNEVTLRDERQCISICTYNEKCRAFDALQVPRGIECRFFDFIMDYFVEQNGILENKEGVKLYSMKFPVKTCQDWYNVGYRNNGVYSVSLPGSQSRSAYCYMEGEGGGWMAFQRRFDGSVDFHTKLWDDYKNGFGTGEGEYWLGNDMLHKITSSGSYDLYVIAKSFDGQIQVKRFKGFTIGSEEAKYVIRYQSVYPGYSHYDLFTALQGDSFTTIDRDNDKKPTSNCAADSYPSGWWFGACHSDLMNGRYSSTRACPFGAGLHWFRWLGLNECLKETMLLLRKES